MRQIHLVLETIIKGVGGHEQVASLCRVTEATVYRWTQPPEKNGKTVPIKHLQTILAESKKHLEKIVLQAAVNELLNDHFAGLCGRTVFLQEKVAEIIYALQDGYKPQRISA
jgi:hypothetical protein